MLVAISIPIFNAQLEKSREATDAANIRAAYAQVQSAALLQDSATDFAKSGTTDIKYTVPSTAEGSMQYQAVVTLKQTQDGWQSGNQDIGGVSIDSAKAKGTATILYDQANGTTTITMSK